MLSLAAFLCFVVVPTCAVAAVLVRGLENAAQRAEREDRLVDLTSNAAEIAMRLESLEKVMSSEAHLPSRGPVR